MRRIRLRDTWTSDMWLIVILLLTALLVIVPLMLRRGHPAEIPRGQPVLSR